MANDFSGDSRCVALWKFEDGALTTDTIGTNTLTALGSPSADTSIYKEGSASVILGTDQGMKVADADLDAGFPLKTGDTTKKITVCGWIYPTAYSGDIFCKLDNSIMTVGSFRLALPAAAEEVFTFTYRGVADYIGGVNCTGLNVTLNQWYHVAVVVDGVAKTYRVRVWDDTGAEVNEFSGSLYEELAVGASGWMIRGRADSYTNGGTGKYDEVVVFDDCLTNDEIDLIRAGDYPSLLPSGLASAEAFGTADVDLLLTPLVADADASYLAITGSNDITGGVGTVLLIAFTTTNTVNNNFEMSGDGVLTSVLPGQLDLASEGGVEIGGTSTLDSVLPTTTELVATGGLDLSGPSVFVADIAITELVASGSLSLSSRCEFGEPEDLGSQTDFVAIGGLKLSSLAALISSTLPTTALVATGGFGLTASCLLDSPAATVHDFAGAISFLMGGQPVSGVINPSVTAFTAVGGFFLSSPGETNVFEAWVLTGQSFEPSMFSAFRFNSFAQWGRQSFAAGDDGIYLLGGDNDNGEAFHTGARIGPINFGADREKRLRGIQMGNCGADTSVKVMADGGDGGEGIFTPDMDENRVVVSRDIQGREFTIDIQDFVELSQFEATPLKLARR